MNLKQTMFFGVVGNFEGHLEQAKEASDFKEGEHPDAPKGIFPIYLPNNKEFLGRFCLNDELILDGDCVQIEPEVAIYFEINYQNDEIKSLVPKKFAAFNDASKRVKAPLISMKKNFSAGSKGLGNWLDFSSWDDLLDYELCSFLKRDGKWVEYGRRESVSKYCYFAQKLCDFLINSLNHQQNDGTLQEIKPLIVAANKPTSAVICIGATPYTEFGECHYLRSGDELFIGLSKQNIDYNCQASAEISCFRQKIK